MLRHIYLSSLRGLSSEEKDLLSKSRPVTLGAAKRIQGVTPVAILELFRLSTKMQALTSARMK